jgi:hypothetical protein
VEQKFGGLRILTNPWGPAAGMGKVHAVHLLLSVHQVLEIADASEKSSRIRFGKHVYTVPGGIWTGLVLFRFKTELPVQ